MSVFFTVIFVIFFLIASPFVLLYQYIEQKEEERNKANAAAAKKRAEAERRRAVEEAERKKAELQKAMVDSFHAKVFPVQTTNQKIQSVWSRWPVALHDTKPAVDRQERALYNTIPILIDSEGMGALFLSTDSIVEKKTYKTNLVRCSCEDFKNRVVPCKHIYRLFYELTHVPYGNPAIVDVPSFIIAGLAAFSDDERDDFFRSILSHSFSSTAPTIKTKHVEKWLASGLLVESPLTDAQYEYLLNKMTKDQIILSLAKKNIKGYYSSWSKYKLVAWVIETQPKYLRRQFNNFSNISLVPEADEWVNGIHFSRSIMSYTAPNNLRSPSFRVYERLDSSVSTITAHPSGVCLSCGNTCDSLNDSGLCQNCARISLKMQSTHPSDVFASSNAVNLMRRLNMCESSKEILDYIDNNVSVMNMLDENIIQRLREIVRAETIYGNVKESAISCLKDYFHDKGIEII